MIFFNGLPPLTLARASRSPPPAWSGFLGRTSPHPLPKLGGGAYRKSPFRVSCNRMDAPNREHLPPLRVPRCPRWPSSRHHFVSVNQVAPTGSPTLGRSAHSAVHAEPDRVLPARSSRCCGQRAREQTAPIADDSTQRHRLPDDTRPQVALTALPPASVIKSLSLVRLSKPPARARDHARRRAPRRRPERRHRARWHDLHNPARRAPTRPQSAPEPSSRGQIPAAPR